MGFLKRWLATAIAAAVAVLLIPGISVVSDGSLFVPLMVFALVLAVITAVVKPILQLLGAPITILTLGLFYLVINGACLMIASGITLTFFHTGVVVTNWLSAIVAAIVISIVTTIASGIIGGKDDN